MQHRRRLVSSTAERQFRWVDCAPFHESLIALLLPLQPRLTRSPRSVQIVGMCRVSQVGQPEVGKDRFGNIHDGVAAIFPGREDTDLCLPLAGRPRRPGNRDSGVASSGVRQDAKRRPESTSSDGSAARFSISAFASSIDSSPVARRTSSGGVIDDQQSCFSTSCSRRSSSRLETRAHITCDLCGVLRPSPAIDRTQVPFRIRRDHQPKPSPRDALDFILHAANQVLLFLIVEAAQVDPQSLTYHGALNGQTARVPRDGLPRSESQTSRCESV